MSVGDRLELADCFAIVGEAEFSEGQVVDVEAEWVNGAIGEDGVEDGVWAAEEGVPAGIPNASPFISEGSPRSVVVLEGTEFIGNGSDAVDSSVGEKAAAVTNDVFIPAGVAPALVVAPFGPLGEWMESFFGDEYGVRGTIAESFDNDFAGAGADDGPSFAGIGNVSNAGGGSFACVTGVVGAVVSAFIEPESGNSSSRAAEGGDDGAGDCVHAGVVGARGADCRVHVFGGEIEDGRLFHVWEDPVEPAVAGAVSGVAAVGIADGLIFLIGDVAIVISSAAREFVAGVVEVVHSEADLAQVVLTL